MRPPKPARKLFNRLNRRAAPRHYRYRYIGRSGPFYGFETGCGLTTWLKPSALP